MKKSSFGREKANSQTGSPGHNCRQTLSSLLLCFSFFFKEFGATYRKQEAPKPQRLTEVPAPPIGHSSHLVFINLITCSAYSVYQAAPWLWDGARFWGEKGYICTSCYGRRLLTHNCWLRSLFLRSWAGFLGRCSMREGSCRLRVRVDSLERLLTLTSYLPLFLLDGVVSRPLFYYCLFLLVFFGKKG